MERHARIPTLRTLLTLDAVTCTVMGGLLLAASGPIASVTQIPAGFLSGAGMLLLPIAAFMVAVARLRPIPGWAAHMVVLGNALWVVASVALPVSGVLAPNLPGWICLLAQAGVVALLAVLEFETAQRSGRALA
ncbi:MULTISPECIES: hypothetical protein [Aurantimonas]|uniref:Integral membrane protein n=1 Tax=Aurantimonas coralicida TaxID=182270 RepID=A0A0P0YYM7_9HYPH|nr:hypothetical protein [Aurantimonas coralicida]BAT26496.1 hypothetical protein [Aurantimonas coralicida]